MLFNFLVLVLIVLITAYLANQGMLSALLALATAMFSSILAMGLLETGQGILGKYMPTYARGGTLLLLFLLAYAITRVAADAAVPKAIKLPLLINRITGGIVGFVTALVVVGTIVIGIEMLPVSNDLVYFDRFGAEGMQGDRPGEVATPAGIWFSPDRFVQAIWNGASHGGLGGSKAWASVHPDLTIESYGYRNIVQSGSGRTVPPDLAANNFAAWTTDDPKQIQQLGIPAESGKRVVLVRTSVQKGDNPPHTSFDTDVFFRVSATQVRLVTDRNHQYYPIGYMDQGRRFTPVRLDSGRLVDDYVTPKAGDLAAATQKWVFEVPAEENPTYFEMKQLAGFDLTGIIKGNEIPAGADTLAYPQHPWLKDLCSVTVTFNPNGATIKAARVYVLKNIAQHKDVDSALNSAYDRLGNIVGDINAGSNGWKDAGKPGIPSADFIKRTHNPVGLNLKNAPDESRMSWTQLLKVLLASQLTPNGERNLEQLPRYMDNDLMSIWRETRGNVLVSSQVAEANGRAIVDHILPGDVTVVCTLQTDRGFFIWAVDAALQKADHKSYNVATDAPDSLVIPAIELPR
jgi:hypothetical protein